MDEQVFEHESYGLLQIHRVHGRIGSLFASAVKHNHAVTVPVY